MSDAPGTCFDVLLREFWRGRLVQRLCVGRCVSLRRRGGQADTSAAGEKKKSLLREFQILIKHTPIDSY